MRSGDEWTLNDVRRWEWEGVMECDVYLQLEHQS